MACSHPGGREGSVCSPLAFLWGTNLRLGCVALVGLYGLLVGLFGLGSVASTEPRPLGTATVQQAWRSERAELEARRLVTEQLVAGRSGLATAHLDRLAPSSEDPGMNPAAFSWFALIYDDLRQPMPAPSIVAIGTAVANSSSWHAVPQQAPRLAGDFSCDCMFRGEREGGYTRQVGPSVDTAIMTTVLSTNRVDSGSFSSRRCAFRRTHTSTDPIRLLCIRLALPLNLFLPSRFAPGTKLMVGVSPRASWPAGAFLRDCTFWDCKGGVLIINWQQVGPLVNTPATTTATGINHVDSGRFSSRCCTFRRTHTSADPIRILCIRLALTLTLSRPPGFTSCARLMVCASPWALQLVVDFSCDCMFWDDRGGGLAGQLGPQVDAANIRTVLSTNHVDSRSFSSRCWGFRRTHPSADPIRLLDIRLALPLTLSLPSGFVPSTKLMVGASPRALGPVKDFSFDCMFWDDRGGGLAGQPMGPQVDTANIRTVLRTNHVDSRSFSSRCWAFRRTHPSADPIRLLGIRLALPLTLSLPSGFVPSTKLMVGASPRALGPVKDFSFDCMFWDDRGGGLAGQPMGPQVDTANIRTVLSTNHVDSRSFSSRCWAFRRTHPSADPIRLLGIRLALPLTLSLPSGFVPSTKLMVGASPRALGLVKDFSCDCTFWDERGGGLVPVDPRVDTATTRTVLSTNRVDSGSFGSGCCAFRRTHTSADPIRLLCIRLALPLTLPLPLRFAPSARLTVGGTPCALWLVGDFSCDCMSWENSGGGLTTQPVSTATMTTVTSANRGDSESFSSRCWTFRRTHTSADPIRVLCTRLALPLTLSLTSRLAPCARLTVDVPTRALWLAGISLRRKKRCAGVVGTRTDWVLKGEEGGMTTPLLQYVARFDEGGEIFGFGGGGYKESWPWCSLFVGFPSLFVAPSGEKPALRFRPRAVVAGRGVVAVCTRISSQEHVYDK